MGEFGQMALGRTVGYGWFGWPDGNEVAAGTESAYGLGVVV